MDTYGRFVDNGNQREVLKRTAEIFVHIQIILRLALEKKDILGLHKSISQNWILCSWVKEALLQSHQMVDIFQILNNFQICYISFLRLDNL